SAWVPVARSLASVSAVIGALHTPKCPAGQLSRSSRREFSTASLSLHTQSMAFSSSTPWYSKHFSVTTGGGTTPEVSALTQNERAPAGRPSAPATTSTKRRHQRL